MTFAKDSAEEKEIQMFMCGLWERSDERCVQVELQPSVRARKRTVTVHGGGEMSTNLPGRQHLKEGQSCVGGPHHHQPAVDHQLQLQAQLPAAQAESKRSLRRHMQNRQTGC